MGISLVKNDNKDLMSFIQDSKKMNSTNNNDKKLDSNIKKDEEEPVSKAIQSNRSKSINSQNTETSEKKGSKYVSLAPKNLPPSYLIDVKYDGKREQAYVKLYNPDQNNLCQYLLHCIPFLLIMGLIAYRYNHCVP